MLKTQARPVPCRGWPRGRSHRLSGACPGTRASAYPRDALRRLALAAVCLAIAIPVIVLAFDYAEAARPLPVPPADRLLQAPPTLRVVALQGDLRIYLPIRKAG